MAMFGIRDALKSGIKRVFGDGNPPPPPTVARPPVPRPAPVETSPAADDAPAAEAARAEPAAPAPEAPAPKQDAAPSTAPTAESDAAPADGPVMTYDEVWELLDEMVRPALQSDGGDISLIKVEDNNVHVKLVGACSTCPSSIMTMKMGVEALLREEFPHMQDLVQVDA